MVDFRVRNVTCDYVLTELNEFNRSRLGHLQGRVPTVRIFGITDTGEKCCAHIHDIFPCIWMRTKSSTDPALTHRLVAKINHLMTQATLKQREPGEPVVAINERPARSFYGFYPEDEKFIEIFFRDPRSLYNVALALQREALSDYHSQPFYSHVPFILQFFIRYDIFGMGFVHFRNVRFRRAPANYNGFPPRSPLSPATNMAVEFDVFASDIKNPDLLKDCPYVNPGLEFVYSDQEARFPGAAAASYTPDDGRPPYVSDYERECIDQLKVFMREDSDAIFLPPDLTTTNRKDKSKKTAERSFDEFNQGEGINYEEEDREELDFWTAESQMPVNSDSEAEELEKRAEMDDAITIDDCDEEMRPQSAVEQEDENLQLDPFIPVAVLKSEGIVRPNYPPLFKRHRAGPFEDEVELPIITIPETFLAKHSRLSAAASTQSGESLPTTSNVDNLGVLNVEILAIPHLLDTGIAVPTEDPILAITYAYCGDVCNWEGDSFTEFGGIIVSEERFELNGKFIFVESEWALFDELAALIRRLDPDILSGYECVRDSWGYICERAAHLRLPFCAKASRLIVKGEMTKSFFLNLGRIPLDIWRIVRKENPLRSYTLSFVVSALLKKSFPDFPIESIAHLYNDEERTAQTIVIRHFLLRAQYGLLILHSLDTFVRTTQMARVYGIQFTEVLNRGSQFRVESMLLRITKHFSLIPPSPSAEQRNRMASPETIPLTLEPYSAIYRDPVVVLDFQSLYPSVSVAYNYCFSTCLGKLSELCGQSKGGTIQLGALRYPPLKAEEFQRLLAEGSIHVSPVGGVFVKSNVRKGVICQMLKELLDARVMVKKSMKKPEIGTKGRRLLNAQQLALKLVANVTYGYTAANWSGRMPCAEVADAIVSKGREALERSISLITRDHERKYEGARVVYGDTDSIFVLFPGKSREDAFRLGKLIADDVTAMNPYPMKLKFEKVMQPCVLITKKHYVGMSYENSPTETPKFDAKGIETVRRDGTAFVSNMMEKCLKVLFEHDAETMLQYLRTKLLQLDRIPYTDFVVHAEYRGPYAESANIPVKKLALIRTQRSNRLTPHRGERLPFVVVDSGKAEKNIRLISCVVAWEHFISNTDLLLNYNYYISRPLFAALGRIMELVPIQLRWRSLVPINRICYGCRRYEDHPFCRRCHTEMRVLHKVMAEKMKAQKLRCDSARVCSDCICPEDLAANVDFAICNTTSCPNADRRHKSERHYAPSLVARHKLSKLKENDEEEEEEED